MNLNNALKKAARFVLAAGQAPVHITVGEGFSICYFDRKFVICLSSD